MRKLYVFNRKIRIPSREREQSYWLLLFNCSIVSDPMDCSMPGFSILHQFLEFTQTLTSNHFILCCPLLLPSIFPSIRVLSSESALRIRWPKYWSISSSNEYSDKFLLGCTGLISFLSKRHSRAYPTPQFKSINSSMLSLFYCPLPHPYMTTGKTIALTIWTFVGKVMSLFF